MEAVEVPDILIYKNGELYSLRDQKIVKGGQSETFGTGSGIVKNDKLYILQAPVKPENRIDLVYDGTVGVLQFIPRLPVWSSVVVEAEWLPGNLPVRIELMPNGATVTIPVGDKVGHTLKNVRITSVNRIIGNTEDLFYHYSIDGSIIIPNEEYPGLLFYAPLDPVNETRNLINETPTQTVNNVTFSEDGAYFHTTTSPTNYNYIEYDFSWDLQRDFTFYCRIKPMTNNEDDYISRGVMILGDPGAFFILASEDDNAFANGRPVFGYGHFRYYKGYAVGNSILQRNQWYELVGVHDYTNKKVRLYIDKVLQTYREDVIPEEGFAYDASRMRLLIGGNGGGINNDNFIGYVKEVKIFDKALSQEEINEL